MPKPAKLLTIVLLLAVITVSAVVIWTKYNPSQPIEITLTPETEAAGEIYIDGAVNNPGIYSLQAGDSIEALLQAAGGRADSADPDRLQLLVPESGETESPQKIDINRAEAWLLQALPGIGETRAQAIVDYRYQNGPFRNTSELSKVSGIGASTYEAIKDLITVSGQDS